MGNLSNQFEPERKFGPKNEMPTTKPVFKKINIISHPELENTDEENSRMDSAMKTRDLAIFHDLPSNVEVHTSQSQIDRAGIRSYIDNRNSHTNKVSHPVFGSGPDVPEVYRHSGKLWLFEGHHRLAASRLKGETSTKVSLWNTGE
jgi:hypothetical protein